MLRLPPIDVSSYTLLVIDDTPTNLQILVDWLEDIGFQVAIARNGESGFERAKYIIPDLILLDVMMPGMDGFETCRLLKNNDKTRDIPVIFMTALDNVEDKIAGFKAGGVDYITKPIQTEEMLARIKTHLSLDTFARQLQEANSTLATRVEERTAELAETWSRHSRT